MSEVLKSSLIMGEVPNDWKSANVHLFKKGNRYKPDNYNVNGNEIVRKAVSGSLRL